jgi:hypothetical protein
MLIGLVEDKDEHPSLLLVVSQKMENHDRVAANLIDPPRARDSFVAGVEHLARDHGLDPMSRLVAD